jgi:Fur family iron response transcriptional regulator
MKIGLHRRNELPGILRSRGISPTRQRLEIAAALFARAEHVSADEVFARVNRSGSRVSKATVYNTLNLFFSKKLIRQVLVDPGRVFYDSNVEPHHHLYDAETGKLIDIDAADVQVTGLPSLPRGVIAEGVDVIVRVRSRGERR